MSVKYSKCCAEYLNNYLGSVGMKSKNKVKSIREAKLMSKSELARKAGVSALTVDRVERGEVCRMETMRKIILALGYSLEDKNKVFQDQA
jgi:DNA-binding XRE family transcriptional regulator